VSLEELLLDAFAITMWILLYMAIGSEVCSLLESPCTIGIILSPVLDELFSIQTQDAMFTDMIAWSFRKGAGCTAHTVIGVIIPIEATFLNHMLTGLFGTLDLIR